MTAPEEPTVGTVDVEALVQKLQADMQKQQAYIDALLAERGVPKDPKDATLRALQDHLVLQQSANPWHAADYQNAVDYAKKLTADTVTDKQAFKLRNKLDRLHEQHGQHELAYVKQLARDLHDHTLASDDEED